jgi:hypothetical protein
MRRFVSGKVAQKLSHMKIHSLVSKRLSAELTRGLFAPGDLSRPAARLSPRSELYSMIRKSVQRFSEKIMLNQRADIRSRSVVKGTRDAD